MHRVAEGDGNFFNYLQRCGKAIKEAGIFAGYALGVVVFLVAHPIIGLVGSIICLIKAAYHGISLNYHWRHTRETDDQGNLAAGTELIRLVKSNDIRKNYMNNDAIFDANDKIRLEHEKIRLHHLYKSTIALERSRCLAKCIIPVAGPIWVLFSENHAIYNFTYGEYGYDFSDVRMIEKHIEKFEEAAVDPLPESVEEEGD